MNWGGWPCRLILLFACGPVAWGDSVFRVHMGVSEEPPAGSRGEVLPRPLIGSPGLRLTCGWLRWVGLLLSPFGGAVHGVHGVQEPHGAPAALRRPRVGRQVCRPPEPSPVARAEPREVLVVEAARSVGTSIAPIDRRAAGAGGGGWGG